LVHEQIKDEKILVSATRLLMMKMSQFDAFLSPLEVFDVDHWNLKGAALALIFLVLGLANTIVGLMETWLEKKIFFHHQQGNVHLLCWKTLGWKFMKIMKM